MEESGDGGGCDENLDEKPGQAWPRERGSRGRSSSSRWAARGAGSSTWAGNGLVSEDHAAQTRHRVTRYAVL